MTALGRGENVRDRVLGSGRRVWDVSWVVNRRKYQKRGFRTKKEALAYRRAQLHAADRGAFVAPSGVRLDTYMREWLDALIRQRGSTIATYRRHLEHHLLSPRVRPALSDVPLQRVTAEDLSRLYRWLFEDDGLSAGTIGLLHTIVRKALRDAVRTDRVTRCVADHANVPTQSRREMKTWSPQEVGSFLETARRDRIYAAWRLLVMTGLRRGELLGLRWGDIDLDTGRIAVRRSFDGTSYGETKTGKQRAWRLDAETLTVLRAHRKTQAEERLATGLGRSGENDPVFTRPDGRPLTPKLMFVGFKRLYADAGLPPLRLHDLRHTAATLALLANIHPKVVSEMLGHSSVAITLDLYSHVTPTIQADAADRIARIVEAGQLR